MSQKESQSQIVNIPSPFLNSVETRNLLRCSERTLIRLYKGYSRKNDDGSYQFVRPALSVTRRGGRVLFAKAGLEKFIAVRTTRVTA